MPLRVYNTLSRKKEEFRPVQGDRVGIYVCGITAYDLSHVGHARSAVVFDAVVRYLRHKGYQVTYVRNYTDVDDKIIKKSLEQGLPAMEIAERYIEEYRRDMEALGVLIPDHEPRPTQYIPQIIETIQTLVRKGHAYQVDQDVYYAVDSFPGYGKLSHRNTEELMAGSRVEVDRRKRNPLDFALWKGAKPGEPHWESPWGPGRPGWHIECSVMSTALLGPTLDIHGGGKDLVFPHHENEIAQAEGANEKPFVKYWLHNGFVNINREKMSKSLGNFLTLRDIFKEYHPEVLRLFLLSKHYRSPLDYSAQAMEEMHNGLSRIYHTLERMDQVCGRKTPQASSAEGLGEEEKVLWHKARSLMERFEEAMDDDFNTARAIGYLFDLVKSANRVLEAAPGRMEDSTVACLLEARQALREAGGVLGLLQLEPQDFFAFKKQKVLEKCPLDPQEIDRLVAERAQARREKDWARADQIREQLKKWNIILEDRPEGTVWRIA